MGNTVAVMGSTGSIGTQTLEVVEAAADRYEVTALGAGRSVEALAAQARAVRPKVVALADAASAPRLARLLPPGTELLAGPEALATAAATADIAVNGVVGFAGLPVTVAVLEAGRRLALANKESLIAAGPVVARSAATPGAEILPVDSEHCAVHQCLRSNDTLGAPERLAQVSRILLTASGGPFRGRSRAELTTVSPSEALAHPTWDMGPKITVDSSTLMNKGLEVIEAHELFGLDYDRIDVVVHPQSVVHSMVEFTDGATMAQLSLPDMRLCIGYAIGFPDRLDQAYGRIDWATLRRLDFEPPRPDVFACLRLSYEAGRRGETAPAVLSAANEVAVEAFLAGAISWTAIAEVIDGVLQADPIRRAASLEDVLEADRGARRAASAIVAQRAEAA